MGGDETCRLVFTDLPLVIALENFPPFFIFCNPHTTVEQGSIHQYEFMSN